MNKHFLNLTNGIEVLTQPELGLDCENVHFIRIQSTACEQKRWDFILQELDYTFLLCLALGHDCIVYDYSAKKQVPRALFQGVPFIEYVLNRHWLENEIKPLVRGHNVQRYFGEVYDGLDQLTLKKLDYLKKYVRVEEVKIQTVTGQTVHDGDYEWYVEQITKFL